jgi:hypothetical protein
MVLFVPIVSKGHHIGMLVVISCQKPKTINLVVIVSLIIMQHLGVRAMVSWGVWIMCPSGWTCLDCCFSDLVL